MQQGYGNDGGFEKLLGEAKEERGDGRGGWGEWSEGKEHVARTPEEEVAARLVRNRGAVLADAIRNGGVECEGAEGEGEERRDKKGGCERSEKRIC